MPDAVYNAESIPSGSMYVMLVRIRGSMDVTSKSVSDETDADPDDLVSSFTWRLLPAFKGRRLAEPARNAIAQAPVLPSVFHNLIGLDHHLYC